ncbi:hypothetical protein HDU86_005906 [Geranomyces michiganensis]|nr:hypothetical protein HDU86_005906 [Geranomyces michiganensis]
MARFIDSFSVCINLQLPPCCSLTDLVRQFEKPKESAELISKRLRAGQQLDDELANYIKDRAAVEEKYASELVRLAKKHTLAGADKEFAG